VRQREFGGTGGDRPNEFCLSLHFPPLASRGERIEVRGENCSVSTLTLPLSLVQGEATRLRTAKHR
jgi:hypothetical protein